MSGKKLPASITPFPPLPRSLGEAEAYLKAITRFQAEVETPAGTTIITDPDREFVRLLEELSNAIKLTTGQTAALTIWPTDVPFGALRAQVVGTYAGMRIVAPAAAVNSLPKRGA